MADEVRQKFEAWVATLPKCIGGQAGCDGNLVGLPHEPNCPMFGKQYPTSLEIFAAGKRAGEIAQQEKIAEQVLDIIDELTPDDAKASDPIAVAYQRIGVLLLDDGAAPEEKKPIGTPQER